MPHAATEESPRFFASRATFRAWLAANHDRVPVLWVGFWKAASGEKGLTYDEAVEESLCYGWIDGLVKRHDALSYKQRFTPRKAKSIWSAVNLKRVAALKAAGLMAAPGLKAFEGRDRSRAGLYSFENREVALSPAFEKRFRAKKRAWEFFAAQPPGYRRMMAFWVMSAKKDETRDRRLEQLVATSAKGERIA